MSAIPSLNRYALLSDEQELLSFEMCDFLVSIPSLDEYDAIELPVKRSDGKETTHKALDDDSGARSFRHILTNVQAIAVATIRRLNDTCCGVALSLDFGMDATANAYSQPILSPPQLDDDCGCIEFRCPETVNDLPEQRQRLLSMPVGNVGRCYLA